MVFEKFTSAYLFQIAREKSCNSLLIICTKNITTTTRAGGFSNSNFFKTNAFKIIQLTTWKCVDWFYTSLLEVTRFTIISKLKLMFLESSSIMEIQRLQEVYCRFEIRRTLRAAKFWKTRTEFFNHCSSLSVRETPSWLLERLHFRCVSCRAKSSYLTVWKPRGKLGCAKKPSRSGREGAWGQREEERALGRASQ